MPPPKNKPARKKTRRASNNAQQKQAPIIKGEEAEAAAGSSLPPVQEPSDNGLSADVKPIEIKVQDEISWVACFVDGEHIVSGGDDEKIRRWQVKDGKEVGIPMNVGDAVCSIAVSPDGKWIVSGTAESHLIIWNAENHEKVAEATLDDPAVIAVDVSPDGTIAATTHDECAGLFSLESTPMEFLGIIGCSDPLQPYHRSLAAIKFSPDGRLFAAATWMHDYIRVYDIRDRPPIATFPIDVSSYKNQSLAWATNSKQLFALSDEGDIHYLDVSTGTTLSKWPIHNNNKIKFGCISPAINGAFIAASANSSVSFWDTETQRQIGPTIHHPAHVHCMAISVNYTLMIGGGDKITLWNLPDILPVSSFDNLTMFAIRHKRTEARLKETIRSLHIQDERSEEKVACLEKVVQELSDEQNETVRLLRADLDAQKIASLKSIGQLEKTNWELRKELAESRKERAAYKEDIEKLTKLISEMMFSGIHVTGTAAKRGDGHP